MNEFELQHINPKVFELEYLNPKVFELKKTFVTYWWHYWRSLMDFIWTGLVYYGSPDYLISNSFDRRHITISGRDFVSLHIPMASVATFKLQADADFKLDDAPDHLWFDVGGNQNTVVAADLYNMDYTRTVVKCLHSSPYDIHAIGLLKSGVILSPAQLSQLHSDFELWLFWSGFLNDYGYLKDNRLLP